MLLLHSDLPGVGTVYHAVAPGVLLGVVQWSTSGNIEVDISVTIFNLRTHLTKTWIFCPRSEPPTFFLGDPPILV